ncbi:glycoside hydrolase family 28 protein [Melanomma pulvis-pyrius CBS 109.77]|uniref:Glycoside hydrolase family 28 protein n=1 Tax=Melanomma pulvis-pyrius CBS 109.77 TaxID=1314802 RepID=A0A6A6XUY5_9PLEO|nr:glycoside hydrolase family 28 protein [Melanomma pulvis-pyrius CBS 109.77]
MHFYYLSTFWILTSNSLTSATPSKGRKTCTVKASGTNKTDDAPAIRSAFSECSRQARIVFNPTTYYVNSVLNITGLEDVEIDIQGTLLWSTDIPYWLNNSLPVGYQNQSTAFVLGGNNLKINGYGTGTFNGNGDYWYEWIRQQPNSSNYPGRPHQITFNGLTNSIVKGVNFLRSQMWTMSIIHSHNSVWQDILVNNTGNKFQSSNTDGADTMFSSHLHFHNWTVHNGDDSISFKANSTSMRLTDSRFHGGLGIAIGSIGQLADVFETVQDISAANVYFQDTLHAFYVKTWTGDRNGYPPNGGGGGRGFASGLRLTNLTTRDVRGAALAVSQCTRFKGAPGQGNCTNSRFQIRDVVVEGLRGSTKSARVASLQCSAVAPCTGIALSGVDLRFGNGTAVGGYLCGHVGVREGWDCTGEVCEGGSATGEC